MMMMMVVIKMMWPLLIMEEILGDILLAWNVDIIRPRMLSLIMKIIDSVPMMTTWPLLVEERALVSERGPGGAGSPSLTHSRTVSAHCTAAGRPRECSAVQWSPVDLALWPCKHLLSFCSAWQPVPRPNTLPAQSPTASSCTPTSSTATSSTSAPTVSSRTF